MRIILMVIFSLILSACATSNSTSNNMASRGQSADLLLKQKGAPSAIVPVENGNTLFVYVTRTQSQVPSPVMTNATTMVGPKGQAFAAAVPTVPQSVTTVKCSISYEVNKQRQVVGVKTEGAC